MEETISVSVLNLQYLVRPSAELDNKSKAPVPPANLLDKPVETEAPIAPTHAPEKPLDPEKATNPPRNSKDLSSKRKANQSVDPDSSDADNSDNERCVRYTTIFILSSAEFL